MKIGFIYQSDYRDLKFESKEKDNSVNDASNRLIKKLKGQLNELKE